MRTMTEVEAWEFLERQFARASVRGRVGEEMQSKGHDLYVRTGLCWAVTVLSHQGKIKWDTGEYMLDKICQLQRMRRDRANDAFFGPLLVEAVDDPMMEAAAREAAAFRASLCALMAAGALDPV